MGDIGDLDTSVEYRELHGSKKEKWSGGKWTATRVFKVAWSDRFRFVIDVVGGMQQISGQTVYKVPARYPGLAVPTYAINADIEPFGVSGTESGYSDMIAYEWAKVTIGYETPEHDKEDPEEQVYVDESWSGSTQIVTLPKGTYTFAAGNKVEESFGLQIGTSELSLKIHQLATLPKSDLESKVGKVNSAVWYGMSVGKVLFASWGAARKHTSNGPSSWDLDLKFLCRSTEWNKLINPANGNWESISPSPYQSTDFSGLLP